MPTLQQEINRKKEGRGPCRVAQADGCGPLTFDPCGYHEDRLGNEICKISAVRMDSDNPMQRHVPAEPEFIDLADRLTGHGAPPAGGWYLVAEQREWLLRELVKCFRDRRGTDVRILEAGIASHNHHFSYISIVRDAVRRADADVRVEVVVVDKCACPIFVSKWVWERLAEHAATASFENCPVPLHGQFAEFVRSDVEQGPPLQQRFVVGDLTDVSSLGFPANSFDIVTEHFISAVLDSIPLLREFRRTYSELLKPQGILLTAFGATPRLRQTEFTELLDIHEECGFTLLDYDYVWDPYGLRAEVLTSLREGSDLETFCDNTVARFSVSE